MRTNKFKIIAKHILLFFPLSNDAFCFHTLDKTICFEALRDCFIKARFHFEILKKPCLNKQILIRFLLEFTFQILSSWAFQKLELNERSSINPQFLWFWNSKITSNSFIQEETLTKCFLNKCYSVRSCKGNFFYLTFVHILCYKKSPC